MSRIKLESDHLLVKKGSSKTVIPYSFIRKTIYSVDREGSDYFYSNNGVNITIYVEGKPITYTGDYYENGDFFDDLRNSLLHTK